jgi:hypothetical protein
MKKFSAVIATVATIAVALLLMSGCLGEKIAERITEEAMEKAIEKEGGGEVDIDLSEGEINIQSEEGEVSISSDEESVSIKSDEGEATYGSAAELPETFPEAVPVYPDMEINSSFESTDDNGKTNWSIGGMTTDPGEDVFNWYKDKMSGWEIEGEYTMDSDGEKSMTFAAGNADLTVSVMVFESEEGEVNVVQTVQEK